MEQSQQTNTTAPRPQQQEYQQPDVRPSPIHDVSNLKVFPLALTVGLLKCYITDQINCWSISSYNESGMETV